MREITFICMMVIGIILLVLLKIGMDNVKKQTQIMVYVHNRAVRLGLYANEKSIDSKEDCFVSNSFLRMHNGGTVDVTYLQNCPYKNLIKFKKDDLFLGE